jgi:hypothetical protein
MSRSASKWSKLKTGALVLSLVALTGCASTSPYKEEYYFQALGGEAKIVATADAAKLEKAYPGGLSLGVGYIDDNVTRYSVALYKDEYGEEDVYPVPFADLKFYGAAEGKFSSFIGNTGLSWSKPFFKVKENGLKYYTNDERSISLAFPSNGILLFASDSYEKAYEESIKNRKKTISDEDAAVMASSVVSCYVEDPKTMFDLGFDLPLSVLTQMKKALVAVDEGEDSYYLKGTLEMKSEKLAKTMLTILRNNEVAKAKRNGEKPDYKALSALYVQDGAFIEIAPEKISDEEMKATVDKISVISGGLL